MQLNKFSKNDGEYDLYCLSASKSKKYIDN